MVRRVPPATLEALEFLKQQAKAYRSHIAVIDSLDETFAQVRATGTLGDRPLVVLVSGGFRGDLSPTDAETYRRLWLDKVQPALVRLSTRGRLVIVEDSGFRLPWERPDAVVEAVHVVVDETQRAGGLD
ncbi:MAG TPA: hypothetical protein VFT39_06570 [Vicinamibacterales bacterium]|nr:hypothetical protein [Vicinamibacterales bacterium]